MERRGEGRTRTCRDVRWAQLERVDSAQGYVYHSHSQSSVFAEAPLRHVLSADTHTHWHADICRCILIHFLAPFLGSVPGIWLPFLALELSVLVVPPPEVLLFQNDFRDLIGNAFQGKCFLFRRILAISGS